MSAWLSILTRTGNIGPGSPGRGGSDGASARPHRWRRCDIFLGVLILLLLLGGCAQESGTAIRFGVASAPQNLDPRFATDAASARINRLLYQRLVDFDDRGEAVPALATWEVLSATHYRFRLKPQRRHFHDGTRLTARDVEATYGFILDPDNASPHRATLELIDALKLIDDDTIDFLLKRPDRLFPAYLVIGIVPSARIAAGFPLNETPVGSGPFRYIARPRPGRLILERSDDGQRFEFVHVADPTVRVLKLLRGEIDLLQNDLPTELIGWLQARPQVKVSQAPGTNYSYLGFNLSDPVTGQLAVRQAVAQAIDRQAIIRYVLGGGARTASALLPADHWAGHPDIRPVPHDPEQARRLLAGLGYTEQHPLALTYKTSSDPLRIRLATVIQDQLGRVGFRVRIQSYDWGTFYGDIKNGRFQVYSLAWVGVHTPDIFRYVFHSQSLPPQGANRGRFHDPQTDELIAQAELAQDYQVQADLYRRLQQRLARLIPYVSLWYEDHVYAARADINGYRLAPDGNYDGLTAVHRSVAATTLASTH
jgi:peptide/nickel transport system substrate-binding protein